MKNRRSRLFGRFLIKHRLQFKLGLYVFILLESVTLVFWYLTHRVVLNLAQNPSFQETFPLNEAVSSLKTVFLIGMVIMGIFFLISLVISNLIAGPIYRM